MQETLMSQGIELMAYGMGVVFVFLTVLIVLTTVMSSLVSRFLPEPEPQQAPKNAPAAPAAAENQDDIVAAISAAIHQHRKRRKR